MGRPAESHIQPAEGSSRARFLLDILGTFTNAQNTAASGTRAIGEGLEVAKEIIIENTNLIVGNSKQHIETVTKSIGDTFKTAADMGGQFANTATVLIFSVPKFLASTAQTMLGGISGNK